MNWTDVIRLARGDANVPPRRDVRSEDEWRAALTPEQFQVLTLDRPRRPVDHRNCVLIAPGFRDC